MKATITSGIGAPVESRSSTTIACGGVARAVSSAAGRATTMSPVDGGGGGAVESEQAAAVASRTALHGEIHERITRVAR